MKNDNPKTISFEDVQKFIENDLKTGNLYKVVSRKYKNFLFNPCLLDPDKIDRVLIKSDILVFCLDKMPSISPPTLRVSAPILEWLSTPTIEHWDFWYKMYVKILYLDKIYFIHAGWLEKI